MPANDPRDLRQLLLLSDLAEVERRAERLIRQAGFTGFVYAFAKVGDWRKNGWTSIINGYGQRWIERYTLNAYAGVDPITDYCFGKPRYAPLMWHYETPAAKAFAEDALAHGIGAGVSHPITTPAGRRGGFSFSLNVSSKDANEYILEWQGWTNLIANYVHDAYQRLAPGMLDAEPLGHPPALSARERECLQWFAAGKTLDEVGGLLSISERTAKFHLRNVRDKFGGISTRQVIARAIALQLIQP